MSDPQIITYTEGREGYVVYKDSIGLLKFYFEFGGGDCVAVVQVPAAENWESVTSRSLHTRSSLLEYLANELARTEMKNGSWVMREHCIEFYSK